jgi:8-oxo-dGTP pyrophosphatase MutT (NUDIX family)
LIALDFVDKIKRIQEQLQLPLPGLEAQELMAGRALSMPVNVPGDARISAVLCLLYPVQYELNVLLIKRMADSTAHSGQVSFPGGSREATDKDLITTALREANEEVGIDASEISILGALTPLYIPVSNFMVHPFIGYTGNRPSVNPSKREVAHIIEVPLEKLFHHTTKTTADVTSPARPGIIRRVNAYVLDDGTVIWGATAMILSELEVLMRNT